MEIEQSAVVSQQLPPNHRSGFVALAGRPNVGKSTLLNAWLGVRLAPVSPKPQTTRTRLLGILTREDAQAIFVDTPGIHTPRTRLGEYMVRAAVDAIPDADVVLFMVDASRPPTTTDRQIARLFDRLSHVPVILAMNKADLLPRGETALHRPAYGSLAEFDASMLVSALTGYHVGELLELAIGKLPLGPRYYPEDQLTDQHERFVASELIREQALRLLEQEVPHALAVVVEDFKERPNGVLYISANLYTEKPSQKGIIIGRKGNMLKRIGREARLVLEEFFGRRVYLDLWVKVRKNWRRNERYLRELGYRMPRRQ